MREHRTLRYGAALVLVLLAIGCAQAPPAPEPSPTEIAGADSEHYVFQVPSTPATPLPRWTPAAIGTLYCFKLLGTFGSCPEGALTMVFGRFGEDREQYACFEVVPCGPYADGEEGDRP